MNTSLSRQIQAIGVARNLVKEEFEGGAISSHYGFDLEELDAALNDAGSTVASLNLTKEIITFTDEELKSIKMACDILGLLVKPKNEEQAKFFDRCLKISNGKLQTIDYNL